MSDKLTIFLIAQVPTELGHAWLQHLRDFDTTHAGCHFSIQAEAPTMSIAEIAEMLRVKPEFKFQDIFKR